MTSYIHCIMTETIAQRVDLIIKLPATSKIHKCLPTFLHDMRTILNKYENITRNIKRCSNIIPIQQCTFISLKL